MIDFIKSKSGIIIIIFIIIFIAATISTISDQPNNQVNSSFTRITDERLVTDITNLLQNVTGNCTC